MLIGHGQLLEAEVFRGESECKQIWTRLIKFSLRNSLFQDPFNLVTIVRIEKKTTVQLAIDRVFSMIQSAVTQWVETRAQIPKFDPKTDEIVSRHVENLELFVR